MKSLLPLTILALAMSPTAASQCRLCAPGSQSTATVRTLPLTVEVDAALDLGRAAQGRGSGGTIAIDGQSGQRSVGGGLIDLGGMSLKGTVRLTGEPFAPVLITLPGAIRLNAPDGASADVTDIRADLPADASLDGSGRLSFSFGGRLVVSGGAAGDFRGRVPVIADYR